MNKPLKFLDSLWQLPFLAIGYLFTWFGPFLQDVGGMMMFFVQIITNIFKRPFEWGELIIQLYHVGVKSIPIVIIAGFFVGGIVSFQFSYALSLFGASQYLGGITTSGTLREVGPILVSIMIAGRVGAFVTAELGTMKVTEQIDAVRCLGADPIKFLVVPRFIAVTTMVFVLTIVGLVIATVGGALSAWLLTVMGISYYISSIRSLDAAWALFNGMAKGLLFGLIMATICCYKGINMSGGTEGVGKAVNSSLVTSAIAIFVVDFIIANIASLTFRVAETLLIFE